MMRAFQCLIDFSQGQLLKRKLVLFKLGGNLRTLIHKASFSKARSHERRVKILHVNFFLLFKWKVLLGKLLVLDEVRRILSIFGPDLLR